MRFRRRYARCIRSTRGVITVDVAEIALAREQESVPLARRFVKDALSAWGMADLIDPATLVCSELATNALLHGAPPVRLVVRRAATSVRIEVHDARHADPVVGRQRLLSSQGRGMALVEMLCTGWGVDGVDGGKVVWAEIGAEPEPSAPASLDELEALWGIDEDVDEQPGTAATGDDGVSPASDPISELSALMAGSRESRAVAELRSRVMVDNMYQFVGLLTADGVLIDVNQPALTAGGLARGDVVGRHFWDCAWWQVSPRTIRDVRAAVRSAAVGTSVRYDVDVWAGAAGSALVTIDFSCRPIHAADGSIPFVVVEGRDITEKKAAEHDLAAAVEQLEAANRRLTELDALRREFIANVSHELRTPLTIILGGADHLLAGTPAADEQRHLHRIRDAGALLLKRVNDLLAAAALEQQRALRPRDVDLAVLARRVCAQYEGLVADRDQELVLTGDDRCPGRVDVDLVESMLSNVVGNAVKFTPSGGRIRVTVQRWGERAVVEVADSGPGIPHELREAVLEPFRQVEGSATRKHEGTGLGLAIAAQVAHRHGGGLVVAQAPEGGALITVTLPLSPPGAELVDIEPGEVSRTLRADVDALGLELARPSPARVATPTGRPHVLVAEDNTDLGNYLVELLEPSYDVTLARDGAQAFELATQVGPALILSDFMMPGMSGAELLTCVRDHERLRDVPVVLLTAKADPQQRVEALRRGAADYVLKPFDPAELLARLANLLRSPES